MALPSQPKLSPHPALPCPVARGEGYEPPVGLSQLGAWLTQTWRGKAGQADWLALALGAGPEATRRGLRRFDLGL